MNRFQWMMREHRITCGLRLLRGLEDADWRGILYDAWSEECEKRHIYVPSGLSFSELVRMLGDCGVVVDTGNLVPGYECRPTRAGLLEYSPDEPLLAWASGSDSFGMSKEEHGAWAHGKGGIPMHAEHFLYICLRACILEIPLPHTGQYLVRMCNDAAEPGRRLALQCIPRDGADTVLITAISDDWASLNCGTIAEIFAPEPIR